LYGETESNWLADKRPDFVGLGYYKAYIGLLVTKA